MKVQPFQPTKPINYDLIKEQLFNAAETGNLESMKEALSRFDETGRHLRSVVDQNGQNILHITVSFHPELAEWLCQNRTDFSSSLYRPTSKYFYKLANFIENGDHNRETSLDLAIKYGTLEKIPTLVTEILKHPVAIDFLAAFNKYNRLDMLESLIDQGLKIPEIDLQSSSYDDTITEVGKKGMTEVLRLCLKNYQGSIHISSVIENYQRNLTQESRLVTEITGRKSDKYDFGKLGNREVIKWIIEKNGCQQYIHDVKTMAINYDDTDMSDFCNQYLSSGTDAKLAGDMSVEEEN